MWRVLTLMLLLWMESRAFGDQPDGTNETALGILGQSRPNGGQPPKTPIVREDGTVLFTYGSTMPTVLCQPLRVVAVSFEVGEHIQDVVNADTERWSIEPLVSGEADAQVESLAIKPVAEGIQTSILVTTSRRLYAIKLRSTERDGMTAVGFIYPDRDRAARWARFRQRRQLQDMRAGDSKVERSSSRNQRFDAVGLNFNYRIEGDDPPWKPERVATDGTRTFIYMPPALRSSEAPAIFVVRARGGLFSEDDLVAVNYRLTDGVYVVDRLFDEAVLIAGVEEHRQLVRIIREGAR